MDSVSDEAVVEAESDRLSTLPLDLIHHILSFMDMKYGVQTCVLSSKWKHIWTTLRHIKFSTSEFEQLGQFSGFTRHVIANRNDETDVSSIELTFDGTLSQILVKVLLNYVVSHNVHKLSIYTSERDRKLPICIFESQSLKYLTLMNIDEDYCITPRYPWDLPNLTTLYLNDIVLCDGRNESYEYLDVFSKCVNLKNLNLKDCYMEEALVFKVSAPRLENLTLNNCNLPEIFISAPKLSSFVYSDECPLSLSTDGLECVEKVDLLMLIVNPHLVVKCFKEFHNAKCLILNSDIIQVLTFYPDLLSSQPSPFHNLKHLNIRQGKYMTLNVPNHIRNYFLNSSPSATITTEAPHGFTDNV